MPSPRPASKSWLRFLPAGPLRSGGEVLLSSFPGTLVLAVLLVFSGALNIFENLSRATNLYAPVFLPVVCLLPFVVGVMGPLVLERVRGVDALSLKRSILTSALSGASGSAIGVFALLALGVAGPGFKPFGAALSSSPLYFLFFGLFSIFISTLLCAIGGATLVAFLSRLDKNET